MQKLLLLLTILTLLYAPVAALPARFDQVPQAPVRSRIVVIAGEEKILMPDGRIIPFGQATICTDDCVLADEIAVTASSRRWVVPALITASIITTVLLWSRDRPRIPPSPPPPSESPTPPVAPVPEPSASLTLGTGLLLFSRFLRRNPHTERKSS